MTQADPQRRSTSQTAGPENAQDIDEFIYLISHDVRASVRALLELPQWIADDLKDAGVEITGPVAQSIELMNRHTARLDRMLMDLLAYSRVGRSGEVGRVDIAACLDQVLEEAPLPKGIRLQRDITAAQMMTREQDLSLCWHALIGNAVKHHHTGQGLICVAAHHEGASIRLSVGDDGPGIAPRWHAKALCPMTTLRPRDEVEGTGMGLAIVSKLAAHYRGEVRLSEREGGGLRVELVLPHGL